MDRTMGLLLIFLMIIFTVAMTVQFDKIDELESRILKLETQSKILEVNDE